METSKLLRQIKSLSNTFNDTEQKIAMYVIENAGQIIYSTISQVAEATKLSEATIFRFCKKIGFKGFQDLKITLAMEAQEIVSHPEEQITTTDDTLTVVNKVFKANVQAINDALHSMDVQKFKQALDFLIGADHIMFAGSGGSAVVALDAQHKFIRTGLNVSCNLDYHMQLMTVSQMTSKDVLFVISHTGANMDMITLLDNAMMNEVKTIAITSYRKCPINDIVDVPLTVVSQETQYRFEAFASRISHLSIIDALYTSVIMALPESEKALQKMRDAISVTRM